MGAIGAFILLFQLGLLQVRAVDQVHVTSHGVCSAPKVTDNTQISAQGAICGILLCISGRQSIDLGRIFLGDGGYQAIRFLPAIWRRVAGLALS